MSGANAPQGGLITLDELERLIRILGMLGSSSDGEVVAAARFAVRWVAERSTDWKTLLSPPEEALPVSGVAAPPDPDALAQAEADRKQAYTNGYRAGMRDMAAQLKAQAAALAPTQPVHPPGHPTRFNPWTMVQNAPHSPLGAGLGGLGAAAGTGAAQTAQGPVRASSGLGGASPGGSWRSVAQDLLARHAQGIPGVFRGGREETFVADLLARSFPTLTQAQDKWLRDIAGRNGMSW